MKILYYFIIFLVMGVVLFKYTDIALVTFAVESAIHHIHKG